MAPENKGRDYLDWEKGTFRTSDLAQRYDRTPRPQEPTPQEETIRLYAEVCKRGRMTYNEIVDFFDRRRIYARQRMDDVSLSEQTAENALKSNPTPSARRIYERKQEKLGGPPCIWTNRQEIHNPAVISPEAWNERKKSKTAKRPTLEEFMKLLEGSGI